MAISARKLKDLAVDAVSVPSAEEIYRRKVEELRAARKWLDGIVTRQIAIEAKRDGKAPQSLLDDKAATLAEIERLERECDLAYHVLPRPAPAPQTLESQRQVRAEAGHLSVQVGCPLCAVDWPLGGRSHEASYARPAVG
jgi:hypothetical protein